MVLFFTGTGNSEYAARFLAEALEDKLVSLNEVLKSGAKTAFHSEKPFVVVSPIYAWRLPQRIEDILKTAEFSGSRDIYVVATMGGKSGNCGKYCEKLCKKRGLEWKGFSGVVMPSNYVVADSMPDEEEARQTLEAALPVLKTLAAAIKAGKTIEKTDKTPAAGFLSGVVNPMFNHFAANSKNFVVSDACVSCGKCAEFCPVNNITIKDGKPSFDGQCMSCFGCINRCPKAAINVKGKSENNGRYVCPPYQSEN